MIYCTYRPHPNQGGDEERGGDRGEHEERDQHGEESFLWGKFSALMCTYYYN